MELIDRQAAIEALHTWFRDGFDEDKWWNSTHVLAAIENLPSVQLSTNLAEVGTDCISRRAVMLRVREFIENPSYTEKMLVDELNGLPSVQPKKGKWKYISDGYVDIYECDQCGKTEDYERNFCPNCGADMRGEQDG